MQSFGFKTSLLLSASLLALALAPYRAQAQTTLEPASKAKPHPAKTAKPAGESINVYGAGSTRQMVSLTARDLRQAAPGTSALKILQKLPGVNFQSADPFGAYEWSERVSIRGFQQNQLGFTLDDIPLGPMDYDSERGLNINRAIMTEDIRSATVSQGAGSVEIPSNSSLGGTVQFFSSDPTLKRGANIQQTFGSNDTFRTFARVDSGILNQTGTRFYVSYAHSTLDKWKGNGGNHYDQVNLKLVQPLGPNTTWTNYFDWSQRAEIDYQDLSKNYLNTLGYHWDNYYPDYAAAYHAAEGIFTHNETLTNDPLDAAYYAGSGLRKDFVGATSLATSFGHGLDWRTTAYAIADAGFSTWVTPYSPSPNGAPLSEQGRDESGQRYGVVSNLNWVSGSNTLNTGIWYENNHYVQNRRLYQEPILGQGPPLSPYDWQNTQTAFLDEWGYAFNTNSFQYHLDDTYQITSALKANAGFKSLVVDTHSDILYNNPAYTGVDTLPSGGLTASNAFLPQLSANWRVTPHDEVFVDLSKNMASFDFAGFNQGTPFSGSDIGAFKDLQKNLKPETAWVYEAGYRISRHWFDGLVTIYRANFANRLLAISTGSIINPISTIQNVGGVTSNGLELSGTVHFPYQFNWYNSFSWNRSTFDADYTDAAGVEAVRGKSVPNIPTTMWRSEISYRYKNLSGEIDENYESRKWVDYMNTVGSPDYFITNLSVRYNFGDYSVMKNIGIQLNVYNLTNRKWIAVVGEEGNSVSGDYQSFMPGAPRQFFGTVSAKF